MSDGLVSPTVGYGIGSPDYRRRPEKSIFGCGFYLLYLAQLSSNGYSCVGQLTESSRDSMTSTGVTHTSVSASNPTDATERDGTSLLNVYWQPVDGDPRVLSALETVPVPS
jgi:hypothetical protein